LANTKRLFTAGILGGAIGGLVSATVSSPQSQFYWWAKEPAYRWNIILWDTVALVMVLVILALITKHKREFLIAALICGIIGALFTVYLKKAYPPD